MSLIEKVRFISGLPLRKKGWLVVFTLSSLLTWFALRFIPMRKLAKMMGHHLENRTVCIPADRKDLLIALEMGQLMSMVANNTPWPCKCLAQALCVKWLLNRYKVPSILHLGAKLDSSHEARMQAHAWVNVHDHTVIGGPQHQHYRVVATFTSPELI